MNEQPRGQRHEERFGEALDAIVRGEATRDSDPLVTFALALQVAEGAANADPLDAGRRAAIWQTVTADQANARPTTGGPGPLPQPALALPNPWARPPARRARRRGVGIVPVAAHVQPFVTALAIVALLLAAWGSFSSFRETGSPSVTPTAYAHGAMFATAEGSPAAAGSSWMTPVRADECDVAPMPFEEYASIMRQQPDIFGRSYDVVGPADPATADAVVRAARAHAACTSVEQARSLETPAYIFFRSANANRTVSASDLYLMNLEHGKKLGEYLSSLAPEQLLVVSDVVPEEIRHLIEEKPVAASPRYWGGFNPALAMSLADGRVALPIVAMVWAKEPQAPASEDIAVAPSVTTQVLILSEVDGAWKIDEWVPDICIGDCDAYWSHMQPTASPVASPAAPPER